jgi:integrase/recombinase XerD
LEAKGGITMHDVLENMRIDLETRDLTENTVATYLRYAGKFIAEVGKPLRKVTRDDVRQYLLALRELGLSPETRNMVLCAVRFLFSTTLRRPAVTDGIRRARTQPKVPVILSRNDVAHLLEAIRSVTYRAMVAVLYGAGLRVSEMCAIRIEDIDSERMQLRIPQGKTGQRYARLTPAVLKALRAHYRLRRPKGPYLFPGHGTGRPITRVAVAKALATVSEELGLRKRVHPHLLRHAFAVHLLELGTDLRTVQLLLGHRCISSTARYLQLSRAQLARAPSPIDLIGSPSARVLD